MTLTHSPSVDRASIETYLDIMFGNLPEGFISMRGIGEKGTKQEGKFREEQFVPSSYAGLLPWAAKNAERWGKHMVATFCVPAILTEEKGNADNVLAMGCMILDLDTDCDTDEARDWLTEHIGEPTMVVRSGGTNGAGSPKRHFYWRLSSGHTEIQRIVELRHILAMHSGGDMQFGVGEHGKALGRAHQPIRIPGTIHSKNGKLSQVALETFDEDNTYSLNDLEPIIRSMPPAPWLSAAEVARCERGPGVGDSLFSAASGREMVTGASLLTQQIHSGNADGVSRYDAFNAVAGHYLRLCRMGEYGPEEAYEKLKGWVLVNMIPAWPDEKIRAEWRALLAKEQKERGPLVKKTAVVSLFSPDAAPDAVRPHEHEVEVIDEDEAIDIVTVAELEPVHKESPLLVWAGHRWVTDPAPDLPFIVKDLIACGEQHMFAAEGGAGKSFTMIDLAMRVAAKGSRPDWNVEWMGQEIERGGTVVLILNEDSMNTVNGRMVKLNKNGLLQAAGDKFIPLPMSSLGGAFTLSDNEGAMTSRWSEMYAALRMIPDLTMVIMDTFSTMLHGPEVDSVIVNEMMRQANQLTGETGAAMLWLHHVRKPGDEPIRNVDDMKNAVRGSTAIIGAMRQVMGMWRAADWDRRCKALGIKPDRDAIWRFAVVKTNLDIPTLPEKTLARRDGRLVDLSDADPYNRGNNDLRGSWLVLAVREAAKAGYPMSKGLKNSSDGLYSRRATLPEEIGRLGHRELANLVDWALDKKILVACSAKGSTSPKWLDIPGGPFTSSAGGEEIAKGSWTPPDWSEWIFDAGQGTCVKGANGAQHVMQTLLAKNG